LTVPDTPVRTLIPESCKAGNALGPALPVSTASTFIEATVCAALIPAPPEAIAASLEMASKAKVSGSAIMK
jgi:hypothetical protein